MTEIYYYCLLWNVPMDSNDNSNAFKNIKYMH